VTDAPAPEKPSRRPARATAALLVALLAFLVWRLGRVAPPEVPPVDRLAFPPVTSEAVAPREGYLAPDFEAVDLRGRSVKLSLLRGQVVFLNFWATWCVPCRKELPAISRLAARLPANVSIVAVATDSQSPDVVSMVRERGIGFPVILDGSGAIAAKYQVIGIPTTLLLDTRGIVVKRISGARAWDHPEFSAWLGRLAATPR